MQIKNYPYGKPTKTLKKAAQWLNRNYCKAIKKEIAEYQDRSQTIREFVNELYFDYPFYMGMPKSISYRLSSGFKMNL